MRTDELRAFLHEHGDDVPDAGASARLAAVRQRVATGRRRRVAAAGGGLIAAVAVVAVAVGPGIPGLSPTRTASGPAASTSTGTAAPAEASPVPEPPASLSHQGQTWDLRSVHTASGTTTRLRATVGRPDEPVLVMAGDDGLAAGAGYRISVDGRFRMSSAGAGGIGEPTWSSVDVLAPGQHVVVAEMSRGTTDGGWVSVAEYVRAD